MEKLIYSIIPARGGSKGIKNKNIKTLLGKPLLYYTAKSSLGSKYISRSILSTDNKLIQQKGKDFGLEVLFKRPKNLSHDNSPGLPVIQHALRWLLDKENLKPDIVVILQPTSPLRETRHIDEAIELFLKTKTESLVSVVEVPHNFNPYSVMKLNKNRFLEPFLKYDESKNIRQKKPKFYARNGAAIYICSYSCIMKKNTLFGNTIIPYFMKKKESIDIDDEFDWQVTEMIMKQNEKK